MKTLAQFESLEAVHLPARPLHLAIGMFDGVHLGHRAVIVPAVEAARREGGTAAVLTFWPHPSALFRPNDATPLIQDGPAKAHVLQALGVEAMITQPFTREFASVEAAEFLPWLKRRLPALAAVYVGENFKFGRGRKGDVAGLIAAAPAAGISVFSAPHVTVDGEPVSSTRVRGLLAAGEIEAANALLGYAYFAEGVVTAGKRLGRTIGFPTLNLAWSPGLRPKLGVYAVRVAGENTAALPAVANYGLRPTVEQASEPRLEIHVLGACPLGEGDRITAEWLKFLRPEKKFPGVDELRAQIAADRAAAEKFFGA
ncbi:MAG TPA: riboflavin biosynthesis protein RibF [Opitutaceae bacterium]|nr:riboflavin biosynthesis protein RibF [Opitutaceae bacterium]